MPVSSIKSLLELEVELKGGWGKAEAAASDLDKIMKDLEKGVNMDVSVSDSALKAAVGLAADLDTSTSLKVNVDDSEISSASDALSDIATIGAIDLAINIAGNAKGFIEGLGRFSGFGGIMEMDAALALVQARTGKMIPDAEKLINELYVNGWGESKTQIAGVVAQAAQLGLEGDELEAAVLATLQVVSVTGGDATETLNKLDTASKANGRTFTETADLFIAGYQTGNDKADDLLDTLSEYGTTFKNFRLSAEGAMAFLNSGLDNGVFNSDVLADSVRELGIRLAAIGTDESITAAFAELDSLSEVDLSALLDGYEAGTVTGDDMLQGIIDALSDVAAVDPSKATVLGERVVGTQLEDMGVTVFSKLSTDADTAFGDIEGRAEDAGNAISDTLAVTVDTFLRNIEQMATDFLSSDAIDIDGKIETFKTQLQTAMATAMEGGSIGEVFEAGFGITGIDAALANIGRVFGQIYLSLLEVVAFIQDPTGTTDNDSLTRSRLSSAATAQLPFDLLLANSGDIEGLLKQAVARGVTDIAGGITMALDEALAAGDFDQVAEILQGVIKTTEIPPEAAQALVNSYIAQVNDAMAAAKPPVLFGPELAPADPLANMPSILKNDASNPFNNLQTIFADATKGATDAQTDITAAADETAVAVTTATDAVIASTEGAALAVQIMDTDIAAAMTGNTVTASFEAVEVSATETMAGVVRAVQSVTPHILQLDTLLKAVAAAAATVQQSVNTAVAGAGASAGGGNTTNINVNNTTNVQSQAQAAANGYQLGAQIRGMA